MQHNIKKMLKYNKNNYKSTKTLDFCMTIALLNLNKFWITPEYSLYFVVKIIIIYSECSVYFVVKMRII
jgi:hypothetical protein